MKSNNSNNTLYSFSIYSKYSEISFYFLFHKTISNSFNYKIDFRIIIPNEKIPDCI